MEEKRAKIIQYISKEKLGDLFYQISKLQIKLT